MEKSIKKRVDQILNKYQGEGFDVCYYLFDLLATMSQEDNNQVEVFQYICEQFKECESDDSIYVESSPFSNEIEILKSKYGDLVNSILDTYIKENYEDKEFYNIIWNVIWESTIFDSMKKKVFAFYYIVIDVRIPYFKLDVTEKYLMSDGQYRELRKRYLKEAQKINFIQKSYFNQKTERASTLLAQFGISVPAETAPLEEIEDYEKKLIQMVEIIIDKETTLERAKLFFESLM